MDEPQIEQLTEEALEALQRGDHVRAVAIADQLAAVKPDDPVIRAIRAQALLASDAGEEAFEEARRAVELDPENEHAHLLLGLAAWRAERLTLAQQSLEQALELSGRKPGMLVDYAWFMASERGPRLAEEAASEAVRAAGNSSTAWAALGLAQFRLRRRSEAEASLKRALELDPNDPYAQSVMVTLLQEQRQDGKAMALAHLLEDTPGTEHFVEAVREQAKQRQIAKKLLERAVDPDAAGAEPHRHHWVWLFTAAIMIVGLLLLVQPDSPLLILLCVLFPLLLVSRLRRFFD